jgi:hypothetical protein
VEGDEVIRRAALNRRFLVVVLALALAGCGGQSSSGHSGGVSSHPGSSQGGSTAPQAPGGGSSSAPRCATSGMEVWLGLGEGGAAAGSIYYPIEFTNVSAHICRLFGFPGVSAYSDGHQVGSPAQRSHSVPERSVTLAPGSTAHTTLQIVDVSNFPAASCKPLTAAELKVYPPDDFAAAYIPFSLRACSATGTIFLSVQPIQAGVGVPGR